ncbi:DUF262 domain-containing protein [Pseudomonas sp. BP8]|uniref:DUF262 domain-containing protein n=1 Tax=Pseudomonas sp. BP8 TaxID=2817864 RepID=UPI001AE1CAE5|nr:DUF262 domain-containing protein [Pseudomonas sp. BP8]MBP2261255.1 hypothetical protein [Pseudomonas sp. BP8]HDS1736247.1 DUF262 domain-containing protein [Pseudomonas putida]
MRLVPWDPDIQTVMTRIESLALDLQPNFQRGEVWPKSKKQRLIDSVLREWHVPPIHVIENPETRKQEVLDGQQRLVAIRDFVRGEFAVDGSTDPLDPKIQDLDGLKYRMLPDEVKRQFDQFTLRLYRIVDFKPSEPAELFYRLNQPSNLTGAEQRNAFYGPVRDQIRELVLSLEARGVGKEQFGFSNARMAYDDVICRVALTVKRGTIATKIIGNDLVELYRSEEPLGGHDRSCLASCLDLFVESCATVPKPKFNKATLYSWLVFVARGTLLGAFDSKHSKYIGQFLTYFHLLGVESSQREEGSEASSALALIPIYEDRATSRVADVSSILLRDFAIWYAFLEFSVASGYSSTALTDIKDRLKLISSSGVREPDALSRLIQNSGWGELK